jgi:hypothetical protein
MRHSLTKFRFAAAVAGAVAMALAGSALAAAPASAAGVNVSTNPSPGCQSSQWDFCLFFSPNEQNAWFGAVGTLPFRISNLSGRHFNENTNLAGGAGPVINNVASIANGLTFCNTTVWDNINEMGNFNFVTGGKNGNLTDSGSVILRNRDVSVCEGSCT